MFGIMRRSRWEALAVVLALCGAAPVFAQEAEEPSSDPGPWVAIGFVLLAVAFAIWFTRGSWRSDKRERFTLGGLDAASVVPPLNGARTTDTDAKTKTAALKVVEAVPVAVEDAPKPNVVPVQAAPNPVAGPTPKSLFISYRRQDSQHITGRIYDRLAVRFGKELVFKDVDSIPLGLDFREHIREQVGHCAVLVVVIGKNWNPPAASGQPRLIDPRDHLRIEIESALDRHIPVIPVLVDGIEMPEESELPPSLERLAYHNGIAVRPDPDFHHDMDRLVRGIEQLLK
jgi:hypothetical protein